MALFAAYMQAREKVVKMLTDYLESRPVKDGIYNKPTQTIREDSPEDMEEMLHGQGRDLLTGLLFAGHNTTVDTMVFTVKYVGENPHVLIKIWVIPSTSARPATKFIIPAPPAMDLTALGLGFRSLSTLLQSTDLSSFWLICVMCVFHCWCCLTDHNCRKSMRM
jgi:hypothetical protein